jgi:hypothetical protein
VVTFGMHCVRTRRSREIITSSCSRIEPNSANPPNPVCHPLGHERGCGLHQATELPESAEPGSPGLGDLPESRSGSAATATDLPESSQAGLSGWDELPEFRRSRFVGLGELPEFRRTRFVGLGELPESAEAGLVGLGELPESAEAGLSGWANSRSKLGTKLDARAARRERRDVGWALVRDRRGGDRTSDGV